MMQYQLYTAEQTRELDRLAIEKGGIDGYTLMQRAGQSVFSLISQRWPEASRLAIFCGAGNNAGDGYVVARLAVQSGINVNVYYLSDPERLKGEARQAWQACVEDGIVIEPFDTGIHPDSEVIIDALIGTGLQRDLAGNWLAVVDYINAAGKPIVAVDIPSGINADTGQVMGRAVCADVTVAFIGLNRGLFTGQAPEYTGSIIFDDLQVADSCYRSVDTRVALITDEVVNTLPARSRIAHKGQCGHVLIIGGNKGMAGAPILAGMAALRSGAGLVSIATHPQHVGVVVNAQAALMAHGLDEGAMLNPLIEKASVIIIGPGLGQDAWAQSLLSKVLETRLPVVIDADALNLLSKEPVRRENWILTPHVGEAARLLGCSTTEINADRFASVSKIQQQYGGVVVLKGAGTLIAGNQIKVCQQGNPGMATAGMGDVLAGITGALLAQGLSLEQAAELSVWVHASAGDLEAKARGERGLIATDLLPQVRQLLNV